MVYWQGKMIRVFPMTPKEDVPLKHIDAAFIRRLLVDYGQILLGSAIGAISYPLFLVPNSIAPGGVTGLATILNYLFGVSVGLTSFVMNIPMFVVGFRTMGKRFLWRTLVATVLFSALIDLFKLEPLTHDPMMAAIFGGALLGLGVAIILRGGATTGGTDMLARMVHKFFSGLSVGAFLFLFDFLVVLTAGFTISVEKAMTAMIAIFISSAVVDKVLVGLGTDKACYIISKNFQRITERLLRELERGVTMLNATGGYSGKDVKMLLCVVGRMEVVALKNIVREEDKDAFVFITETHETLGEGFHDLTGESV